VRIFLLVCVSSSLAPTPGAVQYLVPTAAPVGSGTVRIIITAPQLIPASDAKSNDAGSPLPTENGWMIVEESYFTKKYIKDNHFICQLNVFIFALEGMTLPTLPLTGGRHGR